MQTFPGFRYRSKPPIGTPLDEQRRRASDLAMFLPLNENDGPTVRGATEKAVAGSLKGGGTSIKWDSGQWGRCLKTDGVAGYLEVADNPFIRLVDNFTINIWARWNGSTVHSFAINKKATNYDQTAGFACYHATSLGGIFDFLARGSGSGNANTARCPLALTDTNWHMYSVVMRANNPTLYYDTKPLSTSLTYNTAQAMVAGTDPLWIGRRDPVANAFSGGWFDLPQFYLTPLDQAALTRIYNEPFAAFSVPTLFRWGGFGPAAVVAPSHKHQWMPKWSHRTARRS